MRDSYRSIAEMKKMFEAMSPEQIAEMTKMFEAMSPEERRQNIEMSRKIDPFPEVTVDISNDKLIRKITENLQSPKDTKPFFIKPAKQPSSYPLNNCNVNAGHFLSQNKDYKLVRGFKVFQAIKKSTQQIVGFKAVVHFITVDKQGTYYDPTPDDDDEYLFVPSSRVYPSKDDKTFFTRGIKLSAIVHGEDEYKNHVLEFSKLQNGGVNLIFEKPEDMRILEIIKPGDTVTLDGLKNKPELNGKKGTLGKFNIEKRRWEVEVCLNILVDHSNIK